MHFGSKCVALGLAQVGNWKHLISDKLVLHSFLIFLSFATYFRLAVIIMTVQ